MTSASQTQSLPEKQPDRVGLILELLHDPAFVEFELEQESPSIFNAVGRTHTETWHSAFIGWLLDPDGSHGLGLFPLRRFVLVMRQAAALAPYDRGLDLDELLVHERVLTKASVQPSERAPEEKVVENVGRLDIWITGLAAPSEPSPFSEVRILVEMKVNDSIGIEQCQRYIAHTKQERAKGFLVIPVFIARVERLYKASSELFGDPDWIKIDYQVLYDDLIEPCLQHPGISTFGKSTLAEYVKTLKCWQKGKPPMITTERERKLVEQLREDHELAISALYEILSEEGIEHRPGIPFTPVSAAGAPTDQALRVKIGSAVVAGNSVPEFYANILRCLIEGKHLDQVALPIASGSKRYLLSRQPVHPLGNPFKRPIEVDGFFMETNKSRERAIGDLLQFGSAHNIPISVVPM
jgi:hypothetical protein